MNDGYFEILESIASSEPTPGGGSVSALAIAHAHALALMVARLTSGREKWAQGHSAAESVISNSERGLVYSLKLAENDAKAFDDVMSAYRLPKASKEDTANRKEAIQRATIGAASAPLETASHACALLESLVALSEFGNLNALTDLAASAELAHTAVTVAAMNVKINLDSIDGPENVVLANELEKLTNISDGLVEQIRLTISGRLGW